ncbi:hypothetical protein SmJEL517_g03470 [Synchytrium microbalum]|uniref:phosphoinositide 5-phosphatase n=1 Tax=Synchytrium microbalum TaxID=1806994 RepID=A0A507C213_9FUNG|nr:uncharacterized protein SmJEL517_g03470 [Synchytrium microbalum]TPX33752.1 hypothetical protein SmJEL517_g03470 [Synchytrium microbalum]
MQVGDLEGSPIFKINKVAFYSLLNSRYDDHPSNQLVLIPSNNPDQQEPPTAFAHPCSALMKLLSTGSFYFSPTYDLTRAAQKRYTSGTKKDSQDPFASPISFDDKPWSNLFENADSHFVWNRHMLSPLLTVREQELSMDEKVEVDKGGCLVQIMQGFVGMVDYRQGSFMARMAIISRLSCKKAGTRFNARGLNDDGHVSNFVESEFLFYTKYYVLSFLQIRGSVPVFWEQIGVQLQTKIDIARGPESTAPAVRKHFLELQERYDKVHIIDLLSQNPSSAEIGLGEAYRYHIRALTDQKMYIPYTPFDFHAVVKQGDYDRLSILLQKPDIRASLDDFSYFLADTQSGNPVAQQNGVMRINCLDCLDRTNVIECLLARYIIEKHVASTDTSGFNPSEDVTFVDLYNNLWADNADMLSKIYTGTGAIKSAYTRKGKQTLMGFVTDAAKSVNRFYINNFQDKGRQEAIDLLLGKTTLQSDPILLRNPLYEEVAAEMEKRSNEYSSKNKINVVVGTFNVNGKGGEGDRLERWLVSERAKSPDMYVLGIQEMIELTANQMITADTAALRQRWDATLLDAINKTSRVPYVLLRSLHLVALGIFIFVRPEHAERIRNVEVSMKRTGMGGMAGNKGGVSVSLNFNDTSMCFVSAHLAAGEKNVDERNRDYRTITDGLDFRGKLVKDHDLVFWLGDFNYRINLTNEEVRDYVNRNQLDHLYLYDQLHEMRKDGAAFEGFHEGPIRFKPTYKYDNGTDTYDSGEKARAPAWTDRVLWRGRGINLLEYDRAELYSSDHRPVRGAFEVECLVIDRPKREKIRSDLYKARAGTSKNISIKDSKPAPALPPRRDNKLPSNSSNPNMFPTSNGGVVLKTPPIPPPSRKANDYPTVPATYAREDLGRKPTEAKPVASNVGSNASLASTTSAATTISYPPVQSSFAREDLRTNVTAATVKTPPQPPPPRLPNRGPAATEKAVTSDAGALPAPSTANANWWDK